MVLSNAQTYIQSIKKEWYRRRLQWMMLIILFAFAILASRLFYLQIFKGDYYFKLSENNCIRIQRINALRGLIFDRNGEILVENRPSFDLKIVPNDARPLKRTVKNLSEYIQIPPDMIMRIIKKKSYGNGYQPVLIKEDIGRDLLAVISAHRFKLPGVFIDCNAKRHYVFDKLASHLIGYLGEINADELNNKNFPYKQPGDYIGKRGVEKSYENLLSGTPGGRIVQVNANGQVIKILDTLAPKPGHNIFLTIDYKLQKKAELLLEGKVGAVAAMDPSTGEILAMASSPSFDQNLFIGGISQKKWNSLLSNPNHPLTNKVITGEYPPGSTYKIVTAIAGLEEGVIDANSTVYCSGGYKFGNRIYDCWKPQGHGKVNLVQALEESCDVYFYQLGRKLGVDRLAWYAKHCGLGRRTGIDLSPESAGLIPTSDWKKKRFGVPWQPGENLSIAIGQGYDLVTPIQMLTLISAIANGGIIYKPRILKSVSPPDQHAIKYVKQKITGRLPASKETLDIIKQGLWAVVNNKNGTAWWHVHSDKVDISGKTGTSQVVGRKLKDSGQKKNSDLTAPHAWFIGYAPSNDPKIAISVLIEHGGHGSSSAGPIAKQLILSYLNKENQK